MRALLIAALMLLDMSGVSANEAPKTRLPSLVPTDPVQVASGKSVEVKLEFETGWKLNEAAPSYLKLFETGPKPKLRKHFRKVDLAKGRVSLPKIASGTIARLQGTLYFCEAKDAASKSAVCLIQSHDQILTGGGDVTSVQIRLLRKR